MVKKVLSKAWAPRRSGMVPWASLIICWPTVLQRLVKPSALSELNKASYEGAMGRRSHELKERVKLYIDRHQNGHNNLNEIRAMLLQMEIAKVASPPRTEILLYAPEGLTHLFVDVPNNGYPQNRRRLSDIHRPTTRTAAIRQN